MVPITVLVDGGHLGLWIDGTLRAEVHDDQVPPTGTYPGLDVYANERPGTVAIHGLDSTRCPSRDAQGGRSVNPDPHQVSRRG